MLFRLGVGAIAVFKPSVSADASDLFTVTGCCAGTVRIDELSGIASMPSPQLNVTNANTTKVVILITFIFKNLAGGYYVNVGMLEYELKYILIFVRHNFWYQNKLFSMA